ncbi:MAG: phosphate ABC transporter, permease protein PstA, partial [Frankiaceae bacterium]|nr:phosphate ABC transporter, permease protein PstA [Frankiaceae bacterium]
MTAPRAIESQLSMRRKATDRAAAVAVTACFGLALIPLAWLLWTALSRGLHTVLNAAWWTDSQRSITFRVAGGGAYHAIVGTAIQVAITAAISVPVAILVAIYLVEYGTGRFARITSFMLDILTGIPSIVAALFIYAVFITQLGGTRQGLYVSLALAMLMVPV